MVRDIRSLLKGKDAASIAADQAAGITKYYMQMETLDRPAVFTAYAVITYPNMSSSVPSPGYELPPPQPPLTLPQHVTCRHATGSSLPQ